jgi:hypothetical protein
VELEDAPNNLTFESAEAGGTGRGSLGFWYGATQYSGFAVTAPSTGSYVLRLRYSTPQTTATRSISVDGVTATTVSLPSTGSWGTWRTSDIPVTLSAGVHAIQIRMGSAPINVDNVTVLTNAVAPTSTTTTTAPGTTTTTTAPVTTTNPTNPTNPTTTTTTTAAPSTTSTAVPTGTSTTAPTSTTPTTASPTPTTVPTTTTTTTTTTVPGSPLAFIELEEGPNNLSFETAAESGGTGRGSLGYWYTANQYSGFNFTAPATGQYILRLRYATPHTGVTRAVAVNGVVATTASLPSTGSWGTWRTVDIPVTLAVGTRAVEFRMGAAPTNVDNVTILANGSGPPTTTGAPTTTTGPTTTTPAPVTTTTTTSTTTSTLPTTTLPTTTVPPPTTTTPAPPGATLAFIELEDAQHNLSFETAAESGGTGRGSLGYWYAANQYSGFNFSAPSTGQYVFRLRYATPHAGVTRAVLVNGVVATTVSLPSTGGWGTWRNVDIRVSLTAGTRALQFRMGSLPTNVDNVTVLSG